VRVNGFVRQCGTGRCPVSAVGTVVANFPFDPAHILGPAIAADIPVSFADRVAAAADERDHPLRPKLLLVCGLEEPVCE